MGIVVTFIEQVPPARFDDVAWANVQIEEAPAATGSWTLIDTVALSPEDSNPQEPQSRNITTSEGTAPEQWYRLIYEDAESGVSAPTVPVQNVDPSTLYATSAEFFRVVRVTNPSSDQTAAALGDLKTATLEINEEIDFAADAPELSDEALALVKGVCLDRAADLWRHRESAPGILGVVDEGVPTTPGRYSFARYVARLSPLKDQWGIA